ncbi:Transposon Ty3-I Gag-Pol polyprotein [Thelohanellus kitauei]|uniref:Transposon Ty3-I Gag-Pol polyprotein n=1 Tax=Thelohanellus kitauei TaxID=669202 RepID=A0A0C2M889_THEKT|nr:Transposon Ty3-I Gag-Pol polyprotein [Thelohanellus kitauei]
MLNSEKLFSTIGMTSGYGQIPIRDDDKEKTAFTTPFGLYHFYVMPFCFMNAPTTFQRMVYNICLALNQHGIVTYLEDIIIFSDSIDNHLKLLETTFHVLKLSWSKIEPKKCSFFGKE